ncbi:MAG: 2OG-Fe(II) oxygenase [Deltaproteobacteria bacterium]|nr:2OG-Fe(II) oxygenase [Deltaproteobacteria bacterium]
MFILPVRPLPETATYAYVSPGLHDGAFTSDECRRILAMAGPFEAATVQGGVVTETFRRADVSGIALTDESAWIFERIAVAAMNLNRQFWGFDLTGIVNPTLQLVRYRPGHHHVWHRDGCDGSFSTRKLSITVQLCGSDAFEGGELQFYEREQPTRIPKDQLKEGTIIVFPSYLLHCVTPVTSGVRHALVVWIEGPPYR